MAPIFPFVVLFGEVVVLVGMAVEVVLVVVCLGSMELSGSGRGSGWRSDRGSGQARDSCNDGVGTKGAKSGREIDGGSESSGERGKGTGPLCLPFP